jgi:hypothetical protein
MKTAPKLTEILHAFDQARTPAELNKAIDHFAGKIKSARVVKADEDDGTGVFDDAENAFIGKRSQSDKVSDEMLHSLLVEVHILHSDYQELQKAFNNISAYVDKNVDAFIASVVAWITNQATAIQATNVYVSNWFASLPYSIDAKQRIAQALINTCRPFKADTKFWQNVVNNQAAAIKFIEYNPKSDVSV